MADFTGVIRRAIDGLVSNTPQNRQKIYDRARQTIRRQLETVSGAGNNTIFEKQLAKVENAISEIESEYKGTLPTPNETAEHSIQAIQDDDQSKPEHDISESEYEEKPGDIADKDITDKDITDNEQSRINTDHTTDDVNSQTVFESGKAPLVSDNKIHDELEIPPISPPASLSENKDDDIINRAVSDIKSSLTPSMFNLKTNPTDLKTDTSQLSTSIPNHDEIFGFGAEALPEPAAPPSKKSPLIILIAFGLIFILVIIYGIWRVGFDNLGNVIPSLFSGAENITDDTSLEQPKVTINASPSPETNLADQTNENQISDNAGEDKFTQRLNADGTEVYTGPATDMINGLFGEEGRSVVAQNEGKLSPQIQEEQSDKLSNEADGIPILQKMLFYEESSGLAQQTRYEGNVVWSEGLDTGNALKRPYIKARIRVPEREIAIDMSIKLNGDETLPVSHLIDINFMLPDSFDGGEIEQITAVKLKDSEESPGDNLAAISAKIDPGFFVVGLENESLEIVNTNLQLLSRRNWIDIPVSYANGRKALITFEKGASGNAIFNRVLTAWERDTIN